MGLTVTGFPAASTTAREHVASNPIPFTTAGSTPVQTSCKDRRGSGYCGPVDRELLPLGMFGLWEVPQKLSLCLASSLFIREVPQTLSLCLASSLFIREVPQTLSLCLASSLFIREVPQKLSLCLASSLFIREVPQKLSLCLASSLFIREVPQKLSVHLTSFLRDDVRCMLSFWAYPLGKFPKS